MASQDSNHPLSVSPSQSSLAEVSQPHPLLVNGTAPAYHEPSPTEPPGLSPAPTMPALLQALRRRWVLACFSALAAGTLTAVAILLLWPAKYTASTRVQVPFGNSTPVITELPGERVDPTLYRANLAALVKDPDVLSTAVEENSDLSIVKEAGSDPVDWLEKSIKTDYELGPQTLRVKLSGDHPQETAKLLESVVQAFVNVVDDQEVKKRDLLMKMLQKKIAIQEKELESLRKRLQDQKDLLGVADAKTALAKYQSALAELSQAKSAVTKYHLEQIKVEQELKTLRERHENWKTLRVSESDLEPFYKEHPAIQQVYAEIAKAYNTIQQIRQVLREPGPAIAKEKAQIELLEKELDRLRNELRPDLEHKLRQHVRDDLKTAILKKEDELKTIQGQQETMVKEVALTKKRVDGMAPQYRETLEMLSLKHQIDRMEGGLKHVSERNLQLEVEPVTGKRVQWSESNVKAPKTKDIRRQIKVSAVAAILMFGLVMFGVTWWEFRARRVGTADEVSHGLGIHLVGTLPPIPTRARQQISSNENGSTPVWKNRLLESVDAIRTMLLHSARTDGLKVIMITSAEDGEGKTSVASQLAASLARAWRKTLLLDGDLRNPAVHTLFEIPQEPGFSEVLRAEVETADTIHPTQVSRLWAMPAGNWDAHAVQALAQDDVTKFFDKLKEQYDFIIVDSSPVLPVADTMQLAQHVDGVLFSVLRDVSRVPAVYAAHQKLSTLDIRCLGAVVVGDESESISSNYLYVNKG